MFTLLFIFIIKNCIPFLFPLLSEEYNRAIGNERTLYWRDNLIVLLRKKVSSHRIGSTFSIWSYSSNVSYAIHFMLFERAWVETKILNISFCHTVILSIKKKKEKRTSSVVDFPGSPVVKIPHFQCRGQGLDPWSGN